MIVKNHNIVLKDTSPTELARFRQTMLGIWRQQADDEKNAIEMEKFIKEHYATARATASFIPITAVVACIKKKKGQAYSNMSFGDFIGLPMSTPEKSEVVTYNDSQGIKKNGIILLEWNPFNGINLIAKTFKPFIEKGSSHTNFSLTVFDAILKETAFKFTTQDYDVFEALFDSLGITFNDYGIQKLIAEYIEMIKDAKDDPEKLDTIYETLPKTLFGKIKDETLYKHLTLILDSMLSLDIMANAGLGTNEEKAILQILYAIEDRECLYTTLRDTNLLYKIYTKLHGEEIQDLLRFLTRLVAQFDTTKASDTVYFDNTYYLFRDTHVKTNWSGATITVNNYKENTELVGTPRAAANQYELDRMYPPGVIEVSLPKYYILSKPFNPLAKLNFGTKLGELGEQIGDDNTFVIALKLHNMATKQSNWDLFNIATDLLSLLSGAGALRIVLAKGAPMAARVLAGVVLAKDATHYAMLSNDTLTNWHKNGYGWLANLWIAFSVTVDLASFGLHNLSKIAREGKAAAELAETAEDAKAIKKVADEANAIIKAETGKDVATMSEKQFERFVKQALLNDRKIITLADANQLGTANKVELLDDAGEIVGYITRDMRYGAKKGITYAFNATKESGTIKKGSKLDLKCEIKLLDSESAKQYDLTVNQGEEILYCDFNMPSKINEQYSGLGKIIFDDAHTFMQKSKKVPTIDGMFGVWLKHPAYYAHYGGESINLKKFWKAVDDGMQPKEAAFETITGGWAKENGYTKVEIQGEWSREEVIIKFLKEQ